MLWASLAILILALVAAFFLLTGKRVERTLARNPASIGAETPPPRINQPDIERWQAPVPKHLTPPPIENAPTAAAPDDPGSTIVQLGWIVVALAAIAAVYKLAQLAVASGRNVEISWKVTEKVSGKLVIAKVRGRAVRPARAA